MILTRMHFRSKSPLVRELTKAKRKQGVSTGNSFDKLGWEFHLADLVGSGVVAARWVNDEINNGSPLYLKLITA